MENTEFDNAKGTLEGKLGKGKKYPAIHVNFSEKAPMIVQVYGGNSDVFGADCKEIYKSKSLSLVSRISFFIGLNSDIAIYTIYFHE